MATQLEMVNLNLLMPSNPIYRDFKSLSDADLIDGLCSQNQWYAKNVIQLINELSKYKLEQTN
jgi:uncharacterized protein YprB with RNaseH-like and TPR domain